VNLQLIREAINNIRDVVQEKASYRRLSTKELVDVEVYLQQILLEAESASGERKGLWATLRKIF
jgi:hypothetical protein